MCLFPRRATKEPRSTYCNVVLSLLFASVFKPVCVLGRAHDGGGRGLRDHDQSPKVHVVEERRNNHRFFARRFPRFLPSPPPPITTPMATPFLARLASLRSRVWVGAVLLTHRHPHGARLFKVRGKGACMLLGVKLRRVGPRSAVDEIGGDMRWSTKARAVQDFALYYVFFCGPAMVMAIGGLEPWLLVPPLPLRPGKQGGIRRWYLYLLMFSSIGRQRV